MVVLQAVFVILAIILIPILSGFLFALFVAGPIYLLMKAFEYTMYFVINPVIATIRKIPFLGPILCFIITTCIGVPLMVMVLCFIYIPVIVILNHAISLGKI